MLAVLLSRFASFAAQMGMNIISLIVIDTYTYMCSHTFAIDFFKTGNGILNLLKINDVQLFQKLPTEFFFLRKFL